METSETETRTEEVAMVKLNRSETNAVRRIVDAARDRSWSTGKYSLEVTKIRIDRNPRGVYVVINASKPEWKGTMADALCNRYGHFFVGSRGGIRALRFTKGNKTKASKYPLIWGFGSSV